MVKIDEAALEARIRGVVGEETLSVELNSVFRPGWLGRPEALGLLVDEVLGDLLIREGLTDEGITSQWETDLQALFDLLNQRRLDLT